jgi:hypothetical protein
MRTILAFVLVMMVAVPSDAANAQSDAAVKQAIIKQSIAWYPGNCPCPYNTDRAGRSCGRRSAYNRAGGYAPLCFPENVGKADIQAYRQRH